ncbi:MAG: mandelate racemase/muconate lactonizing enzyme family protein [Alphaproteobacteria bacterium]
MAEIEAVDLYYLSLPKVEAIADNSQDSLLIRIVSGDDIGWGECDAAPLASIASFYGPMSHSACRPVRDSVLGEKLDGIEDIARIGALVRANSLDLLQADHTLAGIDMALWDLLGRRLGEPIWRLLGHKRALPKLAYASQLFGDDPDQTLAKGRAMRDAGYRAVKFGWGPFGKGSVETDAEHLRAARSGIGDDGTLLIDAGTIWVDDVNAAAARLPTLKEVKATWLEEPFVSGALAEYQRLAGFADRVGLAGGEGAHNFHMARHMIDHAALQYVQIDAGRMGISEARRVALYAQSRRVRFVNHTFNSHIALSASLQPFAGDARSTLCEYPVEAKAVAREITRDPIARDADGMVTAPDAPGLGVDIDPRAINRYLKDIDIRIDGRTIYRSPGVPQR